MKEDKLSISMLLAFLAGMGVMWFINFHDQHTVARNTAHADTASSGPANPGAVRVDLHVMAQCPYGVQAEAAFKDVVAKFGPDLDLHVDYIGQTGATGEPSSMHGPNEVKGDLFQVCAQKYAPDEGVRLHPLPEREHQGGRHERRGVRREGRRAGRQDRRLRRRARKGRTCSAASFKRSQTRAPAGARPSSSPARSTRGAASRPTS